MEQGSIELFLNWYFATIFWPIVLIGLILSIVIFCIGVYKDWIWFNNLEGFFLYTIITITMPLVVGCLLPILLPPIIILAGLYLIINKVK